MGTSSRHPQIVAGTTDRTAPASTGQTLPDAARPADYLCQRMCMPHDRRLQVRLDEDRYQRVAALARQRRTSMAAVVREAIDRELPSSDQRRRAAADRILGADPTPVPDVPELLTEIDDLRGRRA